MGAGKGCVLVFSQVPLLGLKSPEELASYPYRPALSPSGDRAPHASPPEKMKTDRISQLASYPGLSEHASPWRHWPQNDSGATFKVGLWLTNCLLLPPPLPHHCSLSAGMGGFDKRNPCQRGCPMPEGVSSAVGRGSRTGAPEDSPLGRLEGRM